MTRARHLPVICLLLSISPSAVAGDQLAQDVPAARYRNLDFKTRNSRECRTIFRRYPVHVPKAFHACIHVHLIRKSLTSSIRPRHPASHFPPIAPYSWPVLAPLVPFNCFDHPLQSLFTYTDLIVQLLVTRSISGLKLNFLDKQLPVVVGRKRWYDVRLSCSTFSPIVDCHISDLHSDP